MILLFSFHLKIVLCWAGFLGHISPLGKDRTPFQEGDPIFKSPDSNLPYLMMHRLSLQLKGSDLQLKHRSSDHMNKDMSAFSKTEFLLWKCEWIETFSLHFWYRKICGAPLRWPRNLLPWHTFCPENLTQPTEPYPAHRYSGQRWVVSLLFGDGQPMHRLKNTKSQELP